MRAVTKLATTIAATAMAAANRRSGALPFCHGRPFRCQISSVPIAIAAIYGGALSLLAKASVSDVTIQNNALTGPSRAKRVASMQATSSTNPMKRSGFGDSAAFAIAGTVTASATISTRVRKPRPSGARSAMHASATITSTISETPKMTLVSCRPLTAISISS